MNKRIFMYITIIIFSIYSAGCQCENTEEPDTTPPTVSIVCPTDNSEFLIGDTIIVEADAEDNKGIKEIKFYINEINVHTDRSEPYEYEWDTSQEIISAYNLKTRAIDLSDNISSSSIVSVTLKEENLSPYKPVNVFPFHNADSLNLTITLTWSCSDPEGDSLVYDVFFGKNPNPPIVSQTQTDTFYISKNLENKTTYYWQIVTFDSHGNSSESDTWNFTTKPTPFDWCEVQSGDFISGQGDTIKNINYNYEIMTYEVTNQQFADFLNEKYLLDDIRIDNGRVYGQFGGDNYYPSGEYIFFKFNDPNDNYCKINFDGSSFSIVNGYENHPVLYVSWFGAISFSKYYNFRLPTSEEWEKAARGMNQWDYPWGENIEESRANYWESWDPFEQGTWQQYPQTTPVGFYDGGEHQGFQTSNGASVFGVHDLCGNACEWTNTYWFSPDGEIVVHGGCWIYSEGLEVWYRYETMPGYTNYFTGFRCVKD